MILYPVLIIALSSDETLVDVACRITSKIEPGFMIYNSKSAPRSMVPTTIQHITSQMWTCFKF